jgi:hypothetical protein
MQVVSSLPFHHRDPFLVAQADVEGMTRLSRDPASGMLEDAEVPILTEKALRSATRTKHGKIVAAPLATPLSHPVGHAVGGQGIAVPLQESLPGCSSQVNRPALAHGPQATVAPAAIADNALVSAKCEPDPARIARRGRGRAEDRPDTGIHRFGPQTRRQRVDPAARRARCDGRCISAPLPTAAAIIECGSRRPAGERRCR